MYAFYGKSGNARQPEKRAAYSGAYTGAVSSDRKKYELPPSDG